MHESTFRRLWRRGIFAGMTRGSAGRPWTLLTSHGQVLVEIARNPQALMRELAAAVDLTQRATASIVADLEGAGYVTRQRIGRRNVYRVHLDRPFRHRAQAGLRVGPFLDLLTGGLLAQPGDDPVPLGIPDASAVTEHRAMSELDG
jgi:DNA-binding transcriptional ArsR family regulator